MILPPVLSEFDKKSDQKLPSFQCEYDFVSKKNWIVGVSKNQKLIITPLIMELEPF